MGHCRSIATAVLASVLLPAAVYGATASCSFQTFSAPSGYSLSTVQGVSDDGTVVGQLLQTSTQKMVGFTRSASGTFTEYAAPQSTTTWIYGRNGSALNVGSYQDNGKTQAVHGFFLQGTTFTAVNHPNATNTWLFGVNQVGGASGSYSPSAGVVKGFVLANGKYTTVAYPKAQVTYAMAINDNSEVVGSYASGWVNYGFAWQSGNFTLINYPNAKYGTVLTGVNNSGLIVGNHLSADNTFGFLYVNGVFKNIVYSGARYATAEGINNNGVISGEIVMTGGSSLGYTAVCK